MPGIAERDGTVVQLLIETPDSKQSLMLRHPHDVLNARRQLRLGHSFMELGRDIEKSLVEHRGGAANAFDLVGSFHTAGLAYGLATIDAFTVRKLLLNLLKERDRHNVEFETESRTGIWKK